MRYLPTVLYTPIMVKLNQLLTQLNMQHKKNSTNTNTNSIHTNLNQRPDSLMNRYIQNLHIKKKEFITHKKIIDMKLSIDQYKKYYKNLKEKELWGWRSGDIIDSLDRIAIIKRIQKLRMIDPVYKPRMKLYIFFLFPLIYLWTMTPQPLLEVDPSIFLNHDMIGILRKAILHEVCDGCAYKEISDLVVTDMTQQCTCEENSIQRQLAEELNEKHDATSLEVRKRNLFSSVVISISTAILLTMLHSTISQ